MIFTNTVSEMLMDLGVLSCCNKNPYIMVTQSVLYSGENYIYVTIRVTIEIFSANFWKKPVIYRFNNNTNQMAKPSSQQRGKCGEKEIKKRTNDHFD